MTLRACALVLSACACSATPERDTSAKAPASPPLFTEVTLDTAPGLSGLAVARDGAVWVVSERGTDAYRITLDAQLAPAVTAIPIEGLPAGRDLESLALLHDGRFVMGTEGAPGTEGAVDNAASVLFAELRGERLVVTSELALGSAETGTAFAFNHGVEGACAVGDTILLGFEGVGRDGDRRWAPILRLEGGAVTRAYKLALTSETGKLSALECRRGADGALEALAIERHFEVTRILAFTVGDAADLVPRIALDLSPILRGRLNLEGLSWLLDGRLVAVVDNHWRTITGPSELVVFRPGALP